MLIGVIVIKEQFLHDNLLIYHNRYEILRKVNDMINTAAIKCEQTGINTQTDSTHVQIPCLHHINILPKT